MAVDNIDNVKRTAEAIDSMLKQFHPKKDFAITVPLELLEKAEATKRIFNLVLGSIASISLLVGGIGIMNIMLATVSERTREIGIRRALGAKRRDIIEQFLIETTVMSGSGGLIGVVLGLAVPPVVARLSGIPVVISPWSPIVAFLIAVLTGVIFGVYPARRAAMLDPVEALQVGVTGLLRSPPGESSTSPVSATDVEADQARDADRQRDHARGLGNSGECETRDAAEARIHSGVRRAHGRGKTRR